MDSSKRGLRLESVCPPANDGVLGYSIRGWDTECIGISMWQRYPPFFVETMSVRSPPGGKRIEGALIILAFVRSSVRSTTN